MNADGFLLCPNFPALTLFYPILASISLLSIAFYILHSCVPDIYLGKLEFTLAIDPILKFSKNIYKRAAENEKYLQFISRFKRKNGSTTYNNTQNAEQKKYYKYFKCPGCSQKIRIPRGHGKIEIKCPKCNTKFIRKS